MIMTEIRNSASIQPTPLLQPLFRKRCVDQSTVDTGLYPAYVVFLAGEIWRIDGVPDGNDPSSRDRGGEDDRTAASTERRLRSAVDAR